MKSIAIVSTFVAAVFAQQFQANLDGDKTRDQIGRKL
jgi:hypothetical protein